MTACSSKWVATRQDLLRTLPPSMRIAEIGVWAGDFASDILALADPFELHLIDPWVGMIACGDQHGNDIIWKHGDELYDGVCRRFGRYPGVSIHRGYSYDVLPRFPDHYFDFIYIDGAHDEQAVYADLLLAHEKAWRIGGHDYGPMFPDVVRAVDRFCADMGYRIGVLSRDGCPSFVLERV